MHDSNKIRRGWLDGWFRSSKCELLELEGATPQGELIVDELNKVYERTGVFKTVCELIAVELDQLRSDSQNPVRVLEIGCRDATLLRRVAEQAEQRGQEVALHGVEFQSSLVRLAQDRSVAEPIPLQFHRASSLDLGEFENQSFDIVYSLFSLHHFDQSGLETILLASRRLASRVFFHVDLHRSVWGAALVWTLYTLLGCRRARADSVLSVRRAYRIKEMRAIAKSLGFTATVRALRTPPLYWMLRVLQDNARSREGFSR